MLIYSCAIYVFVCCWRLITALLDTVVSSSGAFVFSFLIAVDAGLRQYASGLLFTLLLHAILIYSCAIYAFALRLAADYRSGRHRRVVQHGFRGQFSDRCGGVAAPVCFPLVFAPLLMTDIQRACCIVNMQRKIAR